MTSIYHDIFLEHDTGAHPENAQRLKVLQPLPLTDLIDGEPFLSIIHKQSYIEQVKDLCRRGGGYLDADTVVSRRSYEAAVAAVAATVMASRSRGFAVVRPPGHHAHTDHAGGFCLFNNIAIAAQELVRQGKKVLIFDFDGHLGDGTERYFYGTDQVMYWSLHQFPAFPHGGDEDEIGEGRGKGFTINVPLPPGSGDDIFFKAVEHVLPAAKAFGPDVVAVSAGFDAYQHDPLLDLRLSASAFYKIGKVLRDNFDNVFAALEGGYNTEALPSCFNNFLRGINGQDIFHAERPTDSRVQVIEEFDLRLGSLAWNLAPYWKI